MNAPLEQPVRSAQVDRRTAETDICVRLAIDGTGRTELASGIAFLDHMLDQVGRHALFDLSVSAKGDLHIDAHHTVEDIGITLGQAFKRALVGTFDVDLIHEFFQGFVNHALVTLHIDNLRGDNAHHQAETVFKAFARALRMACERDSRLGGEIPSTKGSL